MSKIEYFTNLVRTVSTGSKCKRKKVGAIVVDQNQRIVSTGYNGSPKGTPNECEDDHDVTYQTTLHAELNAILFSKRDLQGCDLYVTLSPCLHCAACIIQAGIQTVYYLDHYRDERGIQFLQENGVKVIHVT